jgi:hypothetical protein
MKEAPNGCGRLGAEKISRQGSVSPAFISSGVFSPQGFLTAALDYATQALTIEAINRLVGGRIGTFDVACPMCGPLRRSKVNQRRKTLRIWRIEPSFASFNCARCGNKGYARNDAATPYRASIGAASAKAERGHDDAPERLHKARLLWSSALPISGTIAEKYLRQCRGYHGPLPATLRFLPPRGEHRPAMIAAFGMPNEPGPGQLAIAAADVVGVHLTRLAPDGSDKARTDADKIMIGRNIRLPIIIAPPNDLLGLVITEGIEDALTMHEATGLGAWAAGCASRLPALAAIIPGYIEAVTIMIDDDVPARRHAEELRTAIGHRLEVRSFLIGGAP